jgi:hypothetical protein
VVTKHDFGNRVDGGKSRNAWAARLKRNAVKMSSDGNGIV